MNDKPNIYIMKKFLAIKKWSTDAYYHMKKPSKCYTKWKKLVTKDNIL